jgi:hypothetical protein
METGITIMIYDVGIIGMGVAGAFATLRIAEKHKEVSVIGFDLGRPPMKRRRQLEGWLGALPNSDGKLYQTDVNKVADLTGMRKAKSAHTWMRHVLEQIDTYKIIKDRSPNASLEKKIKKLGYDVTLNDYVQMYPKEIHALSKYMAGIIEQNKNVTFSFDNEVMTVTKQKNVFVITTEGQEFRCKKLIIAVGRSGWRWAKALFSNFGIVDSNDIAKFGIRIETNSNILKDMNRSNCTLTKGDEIEIGPFSWFGTVIPEDHLDMAISAFRSNENRWKTDKVSFSLIGSRPFPSAGFEQTDRIGNLTFVMANDRIIKERVSSILTNRSKISIIPEYEWLKDVITELSTVIPEITTKAYFHVPTIVPSAPKIILGDNLESEVDGMFVAGESAGVHGILAAGLMGIVAADAACK